MNRYLTELSDVRRAIQDTEELRYKAFKSGKEEEADILEIASVELKARERELVVKIGVNLANRIELGTTSLEELTTRVKERVEKMGKASKGLDKFSKILLKISRIISNIV